MYVILLLLLKKSLVFLKSVNELNADVVLFFKDPLIVEALERSSTKKKNLRLILKTQNLPFHRISIIILVCV